MKQLRVGVVGYCPPSRFDEGEARIRIREAYDKIMADFPDIEIIIVSGLTNAGVLKLAYEEAKIRNWKTAGVACKKAYNLRDNWFPVDESPIVIGENWGDESPAFLRNIEALVRVGGGKQSFREAEEMKNRKAYVIEYDLPILG
ncbi:hypothetical protein HYT23_03355 [Candidatus Pacearchaeota archaeon]|nr:hypothetical protein [Candidatus Pacearchaeota archaeon]